MTELRRGMSLMSGVAIPNRMGVRVKIVLRKDENDRYSLLFGRLFRINGVDAKGVVSVPGAAMVEYRFDKEQGKVIREWVGKNTLNYLFRKFIGMIDNDGHKDWFNYVLSLKEQWTPAFLSIFDEKSSAAKEYKNLIKDLDFHLNHGIREKSLKEELLAKRDAFEEVLDLFKYKQSDLLYHRLIEKFTDFFSLYNEEVFNHRRFESYHISV